MLNGLRIAALASSLWCVSAWAQQTPHPAPVLYADPRAFGADCNGVRDSTVAVQAAFASLNGGSGGVQFIPGCVLQLSGPITVTLNKTDARLAIMGRGAILKWTAPGGIHITTTGPVDAGCGAIDVEQNLIFQAEVPDAGDGLRFTNTGCSEASGAPVSTISATFQGTFQGGTSGGAYWTNAVSIDRVSNINYPGLTVYGRQPTGVGAGPGGVGVRLAGVNDVHSVMHNFTGANFAVLEKGILFTDYVEGVTAVQTNFTNHSVCGICVETTTGGGLMLTVIASQFGGMLDTGIKFTGTFFDFTSQGNLYIVWPGGHAITFDGGEVHDALIQGDTYHSATATPIKAVVIGAASNGTFQICGNIAYIYGTFVQILSTLGPLVDMNCANTAQAHGTLDAMVEQAGTGGGTFGLRMPAITDVRQFGAKCDGVANDAPAFVKANALRGINKIGVLNGTCLITNSVALQRPLFIGAYGSISVATATTLTVQRVDEENINGFPFVGAGTVIGTANFPILRQILPTSCASQPTGTVWNNAGALGLCP